MSEPPRRPFPPGGQQPSSDPAMRADVAAAWEARKELGPEYEEHIASGLADRVEEIVAARTAQQRQEAYVAGPAPADFERTAQRQGFVLGIISLGAGIPITGIAAGTDLGLPGLVVAWAGI